MLKLVFIDNFVFHVFHVVSVLMQNQFNLVFIFVEGLVVSTCKFNWLWNTPHVGGGEDGHWLRLKQVVKALINLQVGHFFVGFIFLHYHRINAFLSTYKVSLKH